MSGVIVIGAVLWIGLTLMQPRPPLADASTAFRVMDHHRAVQVVECNVAPGTPLAKQLKAYARDPRTSAGALSLNTYSPGLVIESDLLQVDIGETHVVVSTRAAVSDYWRRRVRPKGMKDAEVEQSVRAALAAVAESPE